MTNTDIEAPSLGRYLPNLASISIKVTEYNQLDRLVLEFFDKKKKPFYGKDHFIISFVNANKVILDWVRSNMDEVERCFQYSYDMHVEGLWKGTPVIFRFASYWKNTKLVVPVALNFFSSEEVCKDIRTRLKEQFSHLDEVSVDWWFLDAVGKPQNRITYLTESNDIIRPEFYPTVSPDPDTFLQDYINSKATVLLMAGPPGTGKTSLLRHLIKKHKIKTHIVYDEKLMERDELFQRFLFDEASDTAFMVVEDADLLLTSRAADQNKLMARFLNISDGLIKLPKRKMIFTTNVNDFDKVDSALLRPGRCFGVIHTRELTYGEARKACEAAGLSIPTKEREYTLAELFNQATPTVAPRSIGFI